VALTPMMQQYLEVKEKCNDCILFFRLGDFYEMFFKDAEIASRELELVLTGRDCGLDERAPMCGIPYHAATAYIGRLVSRGYKIAICEQMEDPSQAKGIVKRDIIKIITPGTYTDSNFLEENKNNYVMSLYIDKVPNKMALSFADISTGEFYTTETLYSINTILDEIYKFSPSEILMQETMKEDIQDLIRDRFSTVFTTKGDEYFLKSAGDSFNSSFTSSYESLKGSISVNSCNALINYIIETQKINLSNIDKIEYYSVVDYLSIDINSRRNLELTETLRDKSKKGSLLWVMDKTCTSMGARQLRKWIEQPLVDKRKIELRLDAVEELVNNISLLEDLKEDLSSIYDIERIVGKISSKNVNAKELISLKNSIGRIPALKSTLKNLNSKLLKETHLSIDELGDIYELIDTAIHDNPSLGLKDGNILKDGYNQEIDELRSAKLHGKEWIASLENSEREETKIRSLKIGYNKVFGYYIEISNANKSLVPEGRYIRKQTLANAERYITPELKEVENKILGAEERLINIEYELFVNIRDEIEKAIDRMKNTAKLIAEVDCLTSLAVIALENNYNKPAITEDSNIIIEEGRHPVIEKMLPIGTFISNNTRINNDSETLLLITGPNMAGKSTYMRQVALITIMAQIGSFVPAKSASISICDKIFTRIGASDDLSSGKSTFMVEMWEVSNILKNATNRSLVLLDEVGRGTSTYDGLSIAWAVIEYICFTEELRCKTLFATHYHELTSLEDVISGVKNYSVAVKEIGNNIVFLRKIVRGGADQSYGVEVAKLAGLPESIISRAKEILVTLEKKQHASYEVKQKTPDKPALKEAAVSKVSGSSQISFDDIEKENLLRELKSIDILSLTPMQGFNKLYDIINKAKSL
jgi:DNA mismatch repair protein MutS